ncbi:MAG TPA: hypothetical protein VK966_09945, partial [Longimicrobiales bacterium]|nr:hypothetical protein [Longimicrobiales bacterium]
MRGAAETLITGSGLTALARRGARDSVAVLAYHNVVEPEFAGRGDASLHLPLDRFVAQVEWIAATHDVVPLDSVAFPRNGQARGRPRAVITFDDAYRGAVRYALPELERRGLPATVF